MKELSKKIVEETIAKPVDEEDPLSTNNLNFNGFKLISVAAAQALSEIDEKYNIDLSDLTDISDEAAAFLAKFKGGSLNLSGLTCISDNTAKAFAGLAGKNYHSFNLNGLTSISEAAADSLSKYKGMSNVELNGLVSLSDSAAIALGKYNGTDKLQLNGLKCNLSEVVVASLIKCADIPLYRLTSLTLNTANAIINSGKLHRLDLRGLTGISDDAVGALAKAKFDGRGSINLNGLTSISDTTAQRIAEFTLFEILLGGLETLTDASAKALSGFKGGIIELNGLNTISEKTAIGLIEFKGTLKLNGLKSLPYNVALTLAGFKGAAIQLNGLNKLSNDEAEALAKTCCDLSLEGLENFNDSHEHLLLLKKLVKQSIYNFVDVFLVKQSICLHLDKIKELSDKAAKIIATRKNKISLQSLTELRDSPEHVLLAKCLAKYGSPSSMPPRLFLNGLTSLSDKAAEALAESEIFIIYLNGLTNLSDTLVRVFQKRKCKHLYIKGLTSLTNKAAAELASGGSFYLNNKLEKKLNLKKK